jgi:hypothetical protein
MACDGHIAFPSGLGRLLDALGSALDALFSPLDGLDTGLVLRFIGFNPTDL